MDRMVDATTVGPGGTTTVTVSVNLEEELELGTGDLVRIEDSFSPAFANISHQEGTPQPGGAGGGPDGQEYLAVWNEGAASYTVVYEVTVPTDATAGTEFDITGTIELPDQTETLPSETITVGIPEETSVALAPSEATAPSDDTATFDLLVTGADAGIGSYSVSLTTDDTAVAAFDAIELTNAADTDNSEIAQDGSSALIDAELSEGHAAEPSITIAELTLETAEAGEATLSVDSADVADTAGEAYDIASLTGATLTVQAGPPPLPGQENPPQDLDGDGRYEDVTGDGEFTIADVQVFFQHRDADVVQNNPEAFNFAGDEPADVTVGDVQALFQLFQNQG